MTDGLTGGIQPGAGILGPNIGIPATLALQASSSATTDS
jgi:hypothetical protein